MHLLRLFTKGAVLKRQLASVLLFFGFGVIVCLIAIEEVSKKDTKLMEKCGAAF